MLDFNAFDQLSANQKYGVYTQTYKQYKLLKLEAALRESYEEKSELEKQIKENTKLLRAQTNEQINLWNALRDLDKALVDHTAHHNCYPHSDRPL